MIIRQCKLSPKINDIFLLVAQNFDQAGPEQQKIN